jgi:hypothetical protein
MNIETIEAAERAIMILVSLFVGRDRGERVLCSRRRFSRRDIGFRDDYVTNSARLCLTLLP